MTSRQGTTADGTSSASAAHDEPPAFRSRPLNTLGTRTINSTARYAGVTGINGLWIEGEGVQARVRWFESRPSRGRRVHPHYSLDDYDNITGWVALAAARGNIRLEEIDRHGRKLKPLQFRREK